MARTFEMEATGRMGFELGRGVDEVTGQALGIAVEPEEPEIDDDADGQTTLFDVDIVETTEGLATSLGLSVEAEGRYGFFSGSAKFEMHQRSQFNRSATYVTASSQVTNPDVSVFDVEPLPSALALRERPNKFRATFGDGYIRSMTTGGEFFIIIELINEDKAFQRELASSVAASYNKLVASVSGSAKVKHEVQETVRRTEQRVLQYQAGGKGAQSGLVADIGAATDRLVNFPKAVLKAPVPLRVQVASYNTLPQFIVNEVSVAALRAALNGCARLRLEYQQVIDELDFVLKEDNARFFEDPPTDSELRAIRRTYIEALNALTAHAIELGETGDVARLGLFVEPPGLEPPRLERSAAAVGQETVEVPDVTLLKRKTAMRQIKEAGLVPVLNIVRVESTKNLGMVVGQRPKPGRSVPVGSEVRLKCRTKRKKSSHVLDAKARERVLASLPVPERM